jgi:hypothetical protein
MAPVTILTGTQQFVTKRNYSAKCGCPQAVTIVTGTLHGARRSSREAPNPSRELRWALHPVPTVPPHDKAGEARSLRRLRSIPAPSDAVRRVARSFLRAHPQLDLRADSRVSSQRKDQERGFGAPVPKPLLQDLLALLSYCSKNRAATRRPFFHAALTRVERGERDSGGVERRISTLATRRSSASRTSKSSPSADTRAPTSGTRPNSAMMYPPSER